jgi:hypothetical protein
METKGSFPSYNRWSGEPIPFDGVIGRSVMNGGKICAVQDA